MRAKPPPSSWACGPHLIHPSLTDPTHHHRQHLDLISHFATIHFLDTQTDRWDRRQVYSNIRSIERERRTKNMVYYVYLKEFGLTQLWNSMKNSKHLLAAAM